MADQFDIFVTGDSGEDVYSWAEMGSRSARPAVRNLPADEAHDVRVPSGAAFIKHVLGEVFRDTETKVVPLRG